jgi:ethanolamine utilization protein EutP (predicted NTPase)
MKLMEEKTASRVAPLLAKAGERDTLGTAAIDPTGVQEA